MCGDGSASPLWCFFRSGCAPGSGFAPFRRSVQLTLVHISWSNLLLKSFQGQSPNQGHSPKAKARYRRGRAVAAHPTARPKRIVRVNLVAAFAALRNLWMTQSGKSMVNLEPLPGSLATLILPPCCSTICFTIAKPRPVPRFFVEKNGSKM